MLKNLGLNDIAHDGWQLKVKQNVDSRKFFCIVNINR